MDKFEDGSGDPYDVRRERVLDDARARLMFPDSLAPCGITHLDACLLLLEEGEQVPTRV